MSRTIDWSKTYRPIAGAKSPTGAQMGSTGTLRGDFQKAQEQMLEQEKAQATLAKAMPIMQNILLQRMVEKRPIRVVRPLPYTCESLNNGDSEEDDGFYAIKKSETFNAKFSSVTKIIPPGTELTFMTLEKSMNQMWFRTDRGEEIGIYLEEQSRLLTQTDIGDLVAAALVE